MNKNIIFLYKFLSNHFFCKNFDLSLFKSFISFYFEKKYLKDKLFLDRIDLLSLKLFHKYKNFSYDYFNCLDSKFSKCSSKIVLLNGCYVFSENINSNIIIDNSDFNILCDLDYLDYKFFSDNLNFFYVLNNIFSLKFLKIKILDDFLFKEKLYILNFYDKSLSNFMFYPNIFIDIGKNSRVNIIESHINFSKKNFINVSSILHLQSFANVTYSLFNFCNLPLLNSHSFFSFQDSYSNLCFNDGFFGKQFFKGFYNFYLYGYKSVLNKCSGRHLKYNSNFSLDCNVFHYGSKSKSSVLFRIVGNDASKCFYKGSIIVGIDINIIEANLKCNGLLLSELSSIVLIPELCISNDNVKCFHGATIGCLYDKFIFYMMSRGLSKNESILIIINEFLEKCINKNDLFLSMLSKSMIENYYMF